MDPAAVFHQSLGSVLPHHRFFPGRPPQPGPYPWDSPEQEIHDAPHRVAHTLTACCRCRQRKTRCDPALPRCLPCERSGSTCEYYDSAKGIKINRSYVVSLQKKVRQLEAELAQYTDQDAEDPSSHDDMVCPGGTVRFDEADEMPRYLGPSSGTAMTRLLMEEAKRHAESRRIANLIPAVLAKRAERRDRMQSVVMGTSISGPSGRTRSYPAHSIIPASALPSREIVDGLVRAFNDRVQVFTPILHEKVFEEDVNAVFSGDSDPYKHFVVNMVVAISLQKVGKYAGLPDSYYLNAMRRFEDVVRPQDLKTLQCLVLIGLYSLMTPTRTATYYVTGLATRICQQMRLGDEQTISLGVSDPRALDMRRRLSWIVTAQELGLANAMGRPNGFSKADDFMNVKFFETSADEDITPEGIRSGRSCEKKEVAIHFCRMRLLQAEIRRVLYDKKRPEPAHQNHPWFTVMEQKLEDWLQACPEQPAWCKPWLVGYYHNMVISLYRPSPQVPKPTINAAMKCFDSSRYIIDLVYRLIEEGSVDVSWESLLIVYAALNALLWSISYPEVRAEHAKGDVQELAASALEAVKIFSDRWPGSSSAAQMYTVIANACLQSYNAEEETPSPPSTNQLGTPASLAGPISPESDTSRSTPKAQPQSATSLFNTSSPFGFVFDTTIGVPALQYGFESDSSPFQQQPTFRSNSIFMSPSTDSNGRRLSHLAPDSNDASAPERAGSTPPPPSLVIPKQDPEPPTATPAVSPLPTLPGPVAGRSPHAAISSSPRLAMTTSRSPIATPHLRPVSPVPPLQHLQGATPQAKQQSPELFPDHHFKQQQKQHQQYQLYQQHQQRQQQQQQQQTVPTSERLPPPAFITPPPRFHHPHSSTQQRPPPPAPPTATDWYNPLPEFVPPYAFSSSVLNGASTSGFWAGAPNPFAEGGGGGGGGLALNGSQHQNPGGIPPAFGSSSNNPQLPPSSNTTNWNVGWGYEGAGLGLGPGSGPGAGASVTGGEFYNSFLNERHGSLSHEQQLELMDVLEAEGMSDIDSFLNMGLGLGGQGQGQCQVGGNGGVPWG
ncbi:hypothetical protein N657DRAFT_577122 [Parathielavia appendiculata]|uniref:Zn(2)-C6 fungal-type domain-containing protein n=1 Tax=Parathielavia appendiculata TaxID=2587402 RepID=A0AAN6TXH8_9PEZI|nr:hypothetical protein N657DRAFT_577122 [Parathielavia appendiculata]